MNELLDLLFRVCVPLAFEAASVFLLGFALIPLLRAKKTGRMERRLGKRFAADGSEPSMGGVLMGLAFAVWYLPNCFAARLASTAVSQDSRGGLISAGVYALLIMLIGVYEDREKQFRGRPFALKPTLRLLAELMLSLTLLISVSLFGGRDTAVMLPFRLGYLELGIFYYPLTAIIMTLAIHAFDLHFCAGSDQSKSVGGLNEVSGALTFITLALCCETAYSLAGSFLAVYAAACCIGMLMWTFPPAKLITGQSGAMLTGGLFAACVVLSKMELLFFTAALPQLISGAYVLICHLKKNKTDQPRSFSEKLRQAGLTDIRILLVSAVMSLVGGALSLLLALYAHSTRL